MTNVRLELFTRGGRYRYKWSPAVRARPLYGTSTNSHKLGGKLITEHTSFAGHASKRQTNNQHNSAANAPSTKPDIVSSPRSSNIVVPHVVNPRGNNTHRALRLCRSRNMSLGSTLSLLSSSHLSSVTPRNASHSNVTREFQAFCSVDWTAKAYSASDEARSTCACTMLARACQLGLRARCSNEARCFSR